MDGCTKEPQLVLEPDGREARVEARRLPPPTDEMIVAQGWQPWTWKGAPGFQTRTEGGADSRGVVGKTERKGPAERLGGW